jgi:hypothetical protein
LSREKAEHSGLFFADAAETKDDAYNKQHNGHNASRQRTAEERENCTSIDRMTHICVGTASYQLMILFRPCAPMTSQEKPSPNRKRDPDNGCKCADPADHGAEIKEYLLEDECVAGRIPQNINQKSQTKEPEYRRVVETFSDLSAFVSTLTTWAQILDELRFQ